MSQRRHVGTVVSETRADHSPVINSLIIRER